MITGRPKKYFSEEERRLAQLERNRTYNASEKGKETHKKYNQSEAGKETQKKYWQSNKGKETKTRYNQSEKGKKNHARCQNLYIHKYPEKKAESNRRYYERKKMEAQNGKEL